MNQINFENTKYLKYANYKNLNDFNYNQLEVLAKEIRDFITEVVYHNGGHYGSNLGVVELSISLLRNFNPELDKIVFDTSHQSYVYKILTDRKELFHTLRTFKGISGFSKIEESKFDHYGAGHAGTGLSAALGYAKDIAEANSCLSNHIPPQELHISNSIESNTIFFSKTSLELVKHLGQIIYKSPL